jgi:hypothetical protein
MAEHKSRMPNYTKLKNMFRSREKKWQKTGENFAIVLLKRHQQGDLIKEDRNGAEANACVPDKR